MKRNLLISCYLVFNSLCAQSDYSKIKLIEESLVILSKKMIKEKDVEVRTRASYKFHKDLKSILRSPESLNYPFDSLKLISQVKSPDKKFRIFTWELLIARNHYIHFGLLQLKNKKTPVVFNLNDISDEILSPEDTICDQKHWYGAFYYNILLKKKVLGHKYYLFGWDMNDGRTFKKVLDVLTIKNGRLIFGSPDFYIKEENAKQRHIIEYIQDASVTLNFDKDLKMIVYDHLIPLDDKDPNSPLVPDGSYHGLKYRNGKWEFVERVFHQRLKDGQAPLIKK